MKKLMVAVAAVAMAAASYAAQIDWSVASGAWKLQDGTAAASGTTVYLIDFSQKTSIISALSADDFEYTEANISKVAGVIGKSTTNDSAGNVAKNTVNNLPASYVAGTTKYGWGYLVVETQANGDVYADIAGSVSKAVYDPLDAKYSTPQQASFTDRQAMDYTKVHTGGDVPEPTSAMLMLLGMAGLALRRRRA